MTAEQTERSLNSLPLSSTWRCSLPPYLLLGQSTWVAIVLNHLLTAVLSLGAHTSWVALRQTLHPLSASLYVSPAFPKPESWKAFLDLSLIPFYLFPAKPLKLGFPFPPLLFVPLKDMPHPPISKRILLCLFPGSLFCDCNSPYWEAQDPRLSGYRPPRSSSTPLAVFVFSPFYPPPPALCGSYSLVKVSG